MFGQMTYILILEKIYIFFFLVNYFSKSLWF